MSPEEQAIIAAAEAWVVACERAIAEFEAGLLSPCDELLVEEAEAELRAAVRHWQECRSPSPSDGVLH